MPYHASRKLDDCFEKFYTKQKIIFPTTFSGIGTRHGRRCRLLYSSKLLASHGAFSGSRQSKFSCPETNSDYHPGRIILSRRFSWTSSSRELMGNMVPAV